MSLTTHNSHASAGEDTVRGDEIPGERSLAALRVGQAAIVTRVLGDDAQSHRLKQLGLCRGRCVELVRVQEPLILIVMNSRLGLARSLAERVRVCLCHPGDAPHRLTPELP